MKKGFTLLELVVAVAIIGVLASAVYLNVRGSINASRDARRKLDLKTAQTAISLYYAKYGSLPTPVRQLVPEFLNAMPTNPKVVNNIFNENGVNGYYYWIDSSNGGYAIVTELDNQNEPDTLSPILQTTPGCVNSSGLLFTTGVCSNGFFGKMYQVGGSVQ